MAWLPMYQGISEPRRSLCLVGGRSGLSHRIIAGCVGGETSVEESRGLTRTVFGSIPLWNGSNVRLPEKTIRSVCLLQRLS